MQLPGLSGAQAISSVYAGLELRKSCSARGASDFAPQGLFPAGVAGASRVFAQPPSAPPVPMPEMHLRIMKTAMFRLYWFDTRTGIGYPCLEWPYAMCFEAASKLAGHNDSRRVRHPVDQHLELHYEPDEVHQKYTALHPAV